MARDSNPGPFFIPCPWFASPHAIAVWHDCRGAGHGLRSRTMSFEMSWIRCVVRLVGALIVTALPALAHAATGPSFDCARVTGRVTRMICASPDLSARDRTLAEHYRALLGQPGTDAADLQR